MTFFAPDADDISGGSSSASGRASNGGTVDLEKLFSDIPFDELDSKTQQAITKAKDSVKSTVATLQKQSIDSPENKEKLDKFNSTLRQLQSERDTALDKLQKLTGGEREPTENEYLKAAQETLRQSGYSEDDIKKQAPVYAKLIEGQMAVFRKELGKDFGPVVGTVILQETRSAFEEAQERDVTGMLDVPEVAEKVWQQIQSRAKSGQPSNADLVLNLAKIAWVDHTSELRDAGKDLPSLRSSKPSGKTEMNTGGYSFPGAIRTAIHPIARTVDESNKPKHQSNSETDAAVEATFKDLHRITGVAPTQFKDKFEKKGR